MATNDDRPVSSLVSQIPTSVPGMISPPGPPAPDSFFDNTELGRNVRNAAMALPGIGGAARVGGAVARVASPVSRMLSSSAPLGVPAAGLATLQQAAAPAAPAAPAAAGRSTTNPPAAGGTPNALDVRLSRPGSSSAPGAQGAVTLAGRGGAPVADAPGVSRFVTPDGRVLYSNVTTPGDNEALMAGRGGTVSTLAGGSGPGGPVSGMSAAPQLDSSTSAALFEARKAAIARGDIAAVAASFGGDFAGAPAPAPSGAALLREQGAGRRFTRAGMQALTAAEANETAAQRAQMEGQGQAVQNTEAQVRIAGTVQTMAAQQRYQQALASGDAKAIAAAENNLRAVQGKWEKEAPDLFTTTAIPGGIDPLTGQSRGAGAIVTNRRTGEAKIISPEEAKGQAAGSQFVSGKVYRDANGNKAKWDGKQFVPVS